MVGGRVLALVVREAVPAEESGNCALAEVTGFVHLAQAASGIQENVPETWTRHVYYNLSTPQRSSIPLYERDKAWLGEIHYWDGSCT